MNLYEIVPIFLPSPSHSLARSLAASIQTLFSFERTMIITTTTTTKTTTTTE